jgi:hypothetical protein
LAAGSVVAIVAAAVAVASAAAIGIAVAVAVAAAVSADDARPVAHIRANAMMFAGTG